MGNLRFLIVFLFSLVFLNIAYGQEKEFLSNGGFESGKAKWVSYCDAAGVRPVDGIGGGVANLTVTSTTTSPLKDKSSGLLTKDATNRQGCGISTDFVIDNSLKAKVMQIDIDYQVNSGTFVAGSTSADSDVIVYIYNVTDGVLLEPSSIKLLSNSSTLADKFTANFQTSATATTYRLILHAASTSASAYSLKFEASVKPSKYVYGTPITDWVSYTPTISGFGTPSNVSFRSRRVGDSLEVKGYYTTGTNTASQAQITLGYGGANANVTIDTTKIQTGSLIGNVVNSGSGATYFGAYAIAPSSAQNYFNISVQTSTTGALTAVNGNSFANSSNMSVELSVPITGWSSSTQISDGYDGRLIAASASTASQTITAGGTRYIINYSNKAWDKTNSITTGASWKFVAPVYGIYEVKIVNGHSLVNLTSTAQVVAELYKNGSFHKPIAAVNQNGTVGITPVLSGSVEVELNADDYIDIREGVGGSVDATINDAHIYISKKQSPQTINATEVVAARYTTTNSQSLTGGATTIVNYEIKTHDLFNSVTTGAGSWKFVAPIYGLYKIQASIRAQAKNYSTGDNMVLYVYKKGVEYSWLGNWTAHTNLTSFPAYMSDSDTVQLNAGDDVDIRLYTNSTINLDNNSGRSHVNIERIK